MKLQYTIILCTSLFLGGASLPACAADDIVVDTFSETETETEPDAGPLMETETEYEFPPGIADSLRINTPTGTAAGMTQAECDAFVGKMFEANCAPALWKQHDDVTAVLRLFDEETQSWKEYCCFYADPELYYSDDWTPDLEELRLLIRGKDECVEDYMKSQRFLCFLNASGEPYRDPLRTPVTLDDSTMDEMLLMLEQSGDMLYAITQLTESSILSLGLDEPEEGAFYTCFYLLDPDTLVVRAVRISLHEAPGSADSAAAEHASGAETFGVRDVRYITYSYDHGMTPFVETGCEGLLRHMDPEKVWEERDLRRVTVILDPGTEKEREYPLTTLKGDPVSCTLPEGYGLFSDEECTVPWLDDGNYVSDLTLWAAPADSDRP